MESKHLDKYLVDKRMVHRNMDKKRLSKKEFENYLKSLKDAQRDCEYIKIKEENVSEKKQ